MKAKLFDVMFKMGILFCCGAGIMPYIAKGAPMMVFVLAITGIVFTGIGFAGQRYCRKMGIK